MSLIPMDGPHITQMLLTDCQQWRKTIDWAKQRLSIYSQNMTEANMNAAGISANDQSSILAFIADLSRFVTLSGGTVPANAADMVFDLNAILGID